MATSDNSATVIREMARSDIESVVEACEWLFAPPGSKPAMWNPVLAAERLKRLTQAERATALVAVRDGRLIGFCTVYLDLESIRMGQRAWLNELAVDPERRSEGVGRQLLARAIEWAGNRGATHVMLDSGTARVDAHRFYRRENPNLEAACFGWLI